MRVCRDPSTARPDAPKGGAEEKIGPLRSGWQNRKRQTQDPGTHSVPGAPGFPQTARHFGPLGARCKRDDRTGKGKPKTQAHTPCLGHPARQSDWENRWL